MEEDPDPTAGMHGTAVGGVAAGRRFNHLGGRGVAPEAGLCGHRILGGGGVTDADEAGAETRDFSDPDFTDTFGGTSSASPAVAGVCALLLEARPDLGWRDIKTILMTTAAKNDPGDPDWTTNGAGFTVNHKYGFGRDTHSLHDSALGPALPVISPRRTRRMQTPAIFSGTRFRALTGSGADSSCSIISARALPFSS